MMLVQLLWGKKKTAFSEGNLHSGAWGMATPYAGSEVYMTDV